MLKMKALTWAFLATSAFAIPDDPKIDLTLLGPIYPPSTNTSLQAWADAKQQATDAINKIIATGNSTYGPLDNQGTAFSASVFSLASDEPLFEFHFEAPTLNGSYTKGKLTENTIYRTGSLGKLLSIYTWLVDIGDDVYSDLITKYVVSTGLTGNTRTGLTDVLSLNWQMPRNSFRILCSRPTGVRSRLDRLRLSCRAWAVIVRLPLLPIHPSTIIQPLIYSSHAR
jgi:hypothetical protein